MKIHKNNIKHNAGFTLIELLVVIAIIGILSGIVLVSTQGVTTKAKRASALSTAASALPELVTCNDDQGAAKDTVMVAGDLVCCKYKASPIACSNVAANQVAGHTATWPDVSKTGWAYTGTPTGDLVDDNYVFTLTRTGGTGTGTDLITCSQAANSCS